MKNAVLALCLSLAAASLPAGAGDQDFVLVNDTGVEIHALYTSPHNAEDWEEDVLGRDTLADGEQVEISFNPKEKAALWDLRIEDDEGNAIEWEKLNLLEISTVTLHYEKGKAWVDVE